MSWHVSHKNFQSSQVFEDMRTIVSFTMDDSKEAWNLFKDFWVFTIIAHHENIAPSLVFTYHDGGGGGKSYLTTKQKLSDH